MAKLLDIQQKLFTLSKCQRHSFSADSRFNNFQKYAQHIKAFVPLIRAITVINLIYYKIKQPECDAITVKLLWRYLEAERGARNLTRGASSSASLSKIEFNALLPRFVFRFKAPCRVMAGNLLLSNLLNYLHTHFNLPFCQAFYRSQ